MADAGASGGIGAGRADRIGSQNAFRRILEQRGLIDHLGWNWNSQKATASLLVTVLLPVLKENRDLRQRIAELERAADHGSVITSPRSAGPSPRD